MSEKGLITLLGTGASVGVPIVGCHCPTCSSLSPYNKRLRPAALVQVQGRTLLLDAGPDVREQLLREKVSHIDGLLLTHSHYDHVGGLDELRVFSFRSQKPLPCLLSEATYAAVRERYGYFFNPGKSTNYSTCFEFVRQVSGARAEFLGLDLDTLVFYQGEMEVTGYRFGNLAYVCDIRDYDSSLFNQLHGVEILIVSALRETPSPVHFSIEEATDFARRVGARQTYFTHITHEVEHDRVSSGLPKGVALGFDGLQIEFEL